MDTLLQLIFLASLATVLPAFAAAILAERKVAHHLRTSHPTLWAEIAPDPLAESNLSSRFARFITQRRYLALGDPKLSQLGEQARKRLYFAASVFLMLVLSALAEGMTGELG